MPQIEVLPKLIGWAVPIIILAVIILPQAIRVLREYERGVIFRLGKLLGAKGPGLIFLIPIVDRMVRIIHFLDNVGNRELDLMRP